MHIEDYAEEEHGQATANLSDDGEIVQVRTRNGFIWRSLQRANISRTLLSTMSQVLTVVIRMNYDALNYHREKCIAMGEFKKEVATVQSVISQDGHTEECPNMCIQLGMYIMKVS